MLIATLPTLVSSEDIKLADRILSDPLVSAVRYNSGGDSPKSPKEILSVLKPMADRYNKSLYVDLEGRQIRVASWSPHSRGSVELNRQVAITLPGKIHFRGVGWFTITNMEEGSCRVYFERRKTQSEYYFGSTQSVHIVANHSSVKGYLGGRDYEYIAAAAGLGMQKFMLSFVESQEDIAEFYNAYFAQTTGNSMLKPELILKIESEKGMQFVDTIPTGFCAEYVRLMAARDDLFLSLVNNRADFLPALKQIIAKDPTAIVASRIMAGIEQNGEMSAGDMADVALLSQYGYQHFMLSDELSHRFDAAIMQWGKIAKPIIETHAKK